MWNSAARFSPNMLAGWLDQQPGSSLPVEEPMNTPITEQQPGSKTAYV